MITLAVDAMGGDAGLAVTIPGALLFLRQQADVRLLMVGDEVQVRQALEAANAPMDRIQVVHAAQVVEMDEQPQSALKNKKDSSMRIAVNQVKEGLAQAAVSAGNTGALMATARFVLKTIQGIERPAIAKFIPSQNGHMTLVLDLGANVDCTPEHLSLTYKIDSLVREEGSYLDLSIGTTVAAPGVDARSYTFSPKITTSAASLVLTPTATAQKPAASEAHATVSVEDVRVDGAAKDASRFTMTARNDSTTPLSDFTISAGRTKGQAQVTTLTCDLTAFGGEVVSAKGPAENLKVSSGAAKVPQGKEITCQVDLTGVTGRNRVKAALTTDGQTFSSDYTENLSL